MLLRLLPHISGDSYLTYSGQGKMAVILQTTIWNGLSWMEIYKISLTISLKSVPKFHINNIPSLVQIMAWCRPCDKPLSETMMFKLLTHICVIRPRWVKVIPDHLFGQMTSWRYWPDGWPLSTRKISEYFRCYENHEYIENDVYTRVENGFSAHETVILVFISRVAKQRGK